MKDIVIKEILDSFVYAVCMGLEEVEEKFTYTLAVIEFITTLKDKGIIVDMNAFNETITVKVHNEITNYLNGGECND